MHQHVTGLVEPARAIFLQLAFDPLGAVPRLPLQGRPRGVYANPLDPAVQAHQHRARRHGVAQSHQQGVPRPRVVGEAKELLVRVANGVRVVGHTAARAAGTQRLQLTRDDRQILHHGEQRHLIAFVAHRGDLRAGRHGHRLLLWRRQAERRCRPRRCRWEQADTQQIEERDVVALRHPVQPEQQLIDHVRERLDQRDAGIGHVVIGPLRAAPLDEPLRVVDKVLEPAVIEIGGGQGHCRLLLHVVGEMGPQRDGHSSDGIV
jgi:hypothetical protein